MWTPACRRRSSRDKALRQTRQGNPIFGIPPFCCKPGCRQGRWRLKCPEKCRPMMRCGASQPHFQFRIPILPISDMANSWFAGRRQTCRKRSLFVMRSKIRPVWAGAMKWTAKIWRHPSRCALFLPMAGELYSSVQCPASWIVVALLSSKKVQVARTRYRITPTMFQFTNLRRRSCGTRPKRIIPCCADRRRQSILFHYSDSFRTRRLQRNQLPDVSSLQVPLTGRLVQSASGLSIA